MKRIAAAVAVLLAAAGVACSSAHGYGRGGVDIEIIADNGDVMRTIPHTRYQQGGTLVAKGYLEAKKGQNYSIVVRNNSADRIGVVIAVDGRNIINGSASNLRSSEPMYIIGPYATDRLDGWRTDSSTTHQFYFTEPSDSYSVRTFADSSAMGVIAVAAFREKQRPRRQLEQSRPMAPAPTAGAAPRSAAKDAASEAAGTGFGEERYSPVVTVAFESESAPFSKTLMKYEWREVLCSKGILRCTPREPNRLWDEGRYAPFPPGYAGR